MKTWRKCIAVVVLLTSSLSFAAPPIGPLSQVPGLKPDLFSKLFEQAKDLTQQVFNNYGSKVGYPEGVGHKLADDDAQCMIYLTLFGLVDQARGSAQQGSAFANQMNKAANYLQRGVDEWCRPRGGGMNRGLIMLDMAARDVADTKHRTNDSKTLEGLGSKLGGGAALSPSETSTLAVLVALLLLSTLIPSPI